MQSLIFSPSLLKIYDLISERDQFGVNLSQVAEQQWAFVRANYLPLIFSTKEVLILPVSKHRHKGWYAQRRCIFTLERYPDFSRRAMLLNAQISGILAATLKQSYDFVVHTAQGQQYLCTRS